jgi:integrase
MTGVPIMDMMNLKRLAKEHYEIRFAYKERLTGTQKIIKRRFHGTLEEARAERDRLKAEAKSASDESPLPKRTLRHYQDSFSRARKTRRGWKVGRATRERDFYGLKNQIIPTMGDWLVREITLADLEHVVDHWLSLEQPKGKGRSPGEPYSVSTINQWIKTTRIYLEWCAKMEGADSPAKELDYLARDKKGKKGTALTGEQTAAFLEHLKTRYPQWYPMCVLGFGTGLRFASLSALRWDDIDKDKGVIVFRESQYRGTRSAGDKMGKIIRIPLIPAFEKALDRHRRWLMEKQHPGLMSGLVFPSKTTDGVQNGHVSKSGIRKAMRITCKEIQTAMRKEAGHTQVKFPRITPHDWRRTFITNSYAKQLDPHAIGDATGHSDPRSAIGYDHVSLERIADVLTETTESLGL